MQFGNFHGLLYHLLLVPIFVIVTLWEGNSGQTVGQGFDIGYSS